MSWPTPHDWKEMRAFLDDDKPQPEPADRSNQPLWKTELREPRKPKPALTGGSHK